MTCYDRIWTEAWPTRMGVAMEHLKQYVETIKSESLNEAIYAMRALWTHLSVSYILRDWCIVHTPMVVVFEKCRAELRLFAQSILNLYAENYDLHRKESPLSMPCISLTTVRQRYFAVYIQRRLKNANVDQMISIMNEYKEASLDSTQCEFITTVRSQTDLIPKVVSLLNGKQTELIKKHRQLMLYCCIHLLSGSTSKYTPDEQSWIQQSHTHWIMYQEINQQRLKQLKLNSNRTVEELVEINVYHDLRSKRESPRIYDVASVLFKMASNKSPRAVDHTTQRTSTIASIP